MPAATLTVLSREQWVPQAQAHAARVDAATEARRSRLSRAQTHAVDDFLYEYYGTRPSLLRRWHPGPGVVLEAAPDHAGWRWYVTDGVLTQVDTAGFWEARGAAVDFVTGLVASTLSKRAQLGCFGLHEWAMVYKDTDTRHPLPLRLGPRGTDAVVESHDLQCTHYDAYRFFTPDATPRNSVALDRVTQADTEQPGCLHATMDLYKWCAKLSPAIHSGLTLDCFELAVDVRRLDMAASPYDVSGLGLAPVRIETPEGKSEYAARQREISERSGVLRRRILEACSRIVPTH
jgi:hypothetical protein